jgi:hypothetical protein
MWLKSDPGIRKSYTIKKQNKNLNSLLVRPVTKEKHYLSRLTNDK